MNVNVVSTIEAKVPSLLFIPIKIRGIGNPVMAMIDRGAMINIVSMDLLKQLKLEGYITGGQEQVKGFGSDGIILEGEAVQLKCRRRILRSKLSSPRLQIPINDYGVTVLEGSRRSSRYWK